MATDSLIGFASASIGAPTMATDSLIGFASASIGAPTRWRRVGGVWLPNLAQMRRVGGSWLDLSHDLDPTTPRPAEGSIEPHTGQPIVYYESLFLNGDTVQQSLNRATSPCVVSFPAGDFTLSNFSGRTKANVETGGALNLEKNLIYGLIGRGAPAWGQSGGTRFILAAGSSTYGGTSWVPTQAQGGTVQVSMLRSVDHGGKFVLRNFVLQGSNQGHNFHSTMLSNFGGDVLIEDLGIYGWCGDNGAPPGETSGLSVVMNSDKKLTVNRVVADGRYANGTVAGTVGIHIMKAFQPDITDCTMVNHRVSAAGVNYHTVDAHWLRCVFAGSSDPSGWPFNAECNTGTVLEGCTFGATNSKILHATFSNTTHSQNYGGTVGSRSLADGTLLVKGGTWGPSGIGGAGNKFAVESWLNGIDGSNTDTQTKAPRVQTAAGVFIPYRWVHGTHQDINTDPGW